MADHHKMDQNVLFPNSYLVCFVAAYQGPNAGVLGNVGNGYWHYQVLIGTCRVL